MMRESSTASSKRRRRRRKVPTSMATEAVHTDQHPPVPSCSGGAAASSVWTEEMHSSFLHRMEAAFVHDILFRLPAGHAVAANRRHMTSTDTGTTTAAAATTTPRLDRYVPDSAESTRDGHCSGDADTPASAPGRGDKRSRGKNGCTAQDISMLSEGAKATSTTADHPHPGPPKESDDDDDDDQVVPLFQMPETGDTKSTRAGAEVGLRG